MLGDHVFELGLASDVGGWRTAAEAHELFVLPPCPAPAVRLRPFDPLPAGEFLSALRRVDGRLQLRTWSSDDFHIRDRWLE
jgi:hypothetical protein